MNYLQRINDRINQHFRNDYIFRLKQAFEALGLGLSPIAIVLLVFVGSYAKTNPIPFIGALAFFFFAWLPYIGFRYILLVEAMIYAAAVRKEP